MLWIAAPLGWLCRVPTGQTQLENEQGNCAEIYWGHSDIISRTLRGTSLFACRITYHPASLVTQQYVRFNDSNMLRIFNIIFCWFLCSIICYALFIDTAMGTKQWCIIIDLIIQMKHRYSQDDKLVLNVLRAFVCLLKIQQNDGLWDQCRLSMTELRLVTH